MSKDYVLQPFHPPVELQIDYARELNAQQHAAVTAAPGPALVIAGAGSGKTRTLTYRVAFLLEHGVPADRILLLTFTNKAAKEMMRRVADLLGAELATLWGGTFHSIGARVLRRHADLLGYRSDFTILDREDANDLIKACLGAAEIDVKETRFPKAEVLADIFSMAVNRRKSVADLVERDHESFLPLLEKIQLIERLYRERKQAANVMDFDDLLALWLKLLAGATEVREMYQRRFQFILVDEYQDTNLLQSELIDLLAARHKNLMVVGDDSQSIYSWRGANFRNILDFPKRYAGARIYKVEVNYRSTPEILALANAAIAANRDQFAKELTAARKPGSKPVLMPCGDGGEQAAFVAQRMLELRDEGFNLNEMAVLYRSHFHALELQLELTRRNIPFSITSGIRFFEQAHIKDVAAHLKLVINPRDELSFKRVTLLLPGIGAKGAEKLWNQFSVELARLGIVPTAPGANPAEAGPDSLEIDLASTSPGSDPAPAPVANPLARAVQACAKAVPMKAVTAWAQFVATIAQMELEPARHQPATLIRHVLEAGYEDYLEENFANFRNRLEDLEQLAVFAQQFSDTTQFLEQLSLLTSIEAEDDRKQVNDDEERVKLSTVHQAKGLEFDVVFIIMLCDGLFPSARSANSVEGEEEERRLFYVAITRARQELYLTYPLIRVAQGSGAMMQQPSRFLAELPPDLIDEWNLRPPGMNEPW
ncbi:MAG TPA: ATP-dependent helicase [Verrucomicrobiae bacterium]|nr:ATP-dependent helicase [Verrucomicrobiae bacterium]